MTNATERLPLKGQSDAASQGVQRSALFVGSVEKAFSVLTAFNHARKPLSLTEIASLTGLGKSAAQRFCYSLVELGYLERDENSKRMRPAAKLLEFSASYLATNEISSTAAPYLLQAREISGQAVNLGLPIAQDIIYVARLPSARSHLVNPVIGGKAPLFCTASGRAYLSTLPDDELKRVLDASEFKPLNRNTITDRAVIMKQIEDVSLNGYATANQECIIGELSIGAPIFHQARGVGAINICVTMPNWDNDRVINELAPIVCQAAHDISHALSA